VAQPVPQHGEVLVKVQAAAINPSDVKNVMGRMSQTTFPRTPGRDFAGVIEQGPADLIGRSVFGTGGDLGFLREARLFGVDTLKLRFVESASVLRGLLKGIESGDFKPPELEAVTLDGAVAAYQAIDSGAAGKKQVIVF